MEEPTTPLLVKAGTARKRPPPAWRRLIGCAASGVVCFAGLAAVGVGTRDMQPMALHNNDVLTETGPAGLSSDCLRVVSARRNNQSTALGGAYPWITKYKALVEPWLPALLEYSCNRTAAEDTGITYAWEIFDGPLDSKMYYGSSVQFNWTKVGPHLIYLAALDSSSRDIPQLSTLTDSRVLRTEVVCKYVRREIRHLSHGDREAFFDAASALWTASLEEGQQRWGPQFFDIQYFVSMHAKLAGEQCCDHMHDGMGFLNHHTAFSLQFERAMQAVNPTVALPYWDYSIDIEWVERTHGGDYTWFMRSQVWQPEWFGSADPELHYVTSGRWAYTKVFREAWNETHNSYGYLRAPWNSNNIPYVTRSGLMCGASPQDYASIYWQYPNCKVMYASLTDFNSYADFVHNIAYAPHGSIHALVGGTLSCAEPFDKLEDLGMNKTHITQWRSLAFNGLKDMFREGFLIFPESCSVDTPFSECHGLCKDIDDILVDSNSTRVDRYIDLIDVLGFLDDYDDEFRRSILKILCQSGLGTEGDQLEAASPMDISFWPIHPTVDRLWQFKVLSNTFTSEEWPTTNYYWGTYGVTGDILGHGPNDALPYDLQPLLTTGFTHTEFYEFSRPTAPNLPYIYDNFHWEHCEELGYNFQNFSTFAGGVTPV